MFELNLYYSPEKSGLRPIGQLNDPDADYSFDMLVVWQHEDGRVLYGSDSGCSCPSPFEDQTVDDLTEVTRSSWGAFQQSVDLHCYTDTRHKINWDDNSTKPDRLAGDKTQLLAKVSAILQETGR